MWVLIKGNTMNIKRRRVLKTVAMAGIVSASASMGLQGCDTINEHIPGGANTTALLMDAFGMDLSFTISGAPPNEIEKVYFYAERTNTMLGTVEQMSNGLSEEFARTFDIRVNAATDAGMTELAEEAANIDPSTMTPEQKQWMERNYPMMRSLKYAGVKTLTSAASIILAIPGAFNECQQDPVNCGVSLVENLPTAGQNLKESYDKVGPVVSALESLVDQADRLADATGITPPTEEEERANASKLASQGLPAGEEAEFA